MNLKKYISLLIYLITISLIVIFIFVRKDEFHHLFEISTIYLIILLLITSLSLLFIAYIFKISISLFNIKFGFKYWFGLSIINSMYNYILPARGGMAIRAVYLKKKHNFPYAQYLSFTVGSYLLGFFTSSLIALLVSLILYLNYEINFLFIHLSLFLFILTSLAIFIAIKIKPQNISENNKILKFFKNASEGLHFFKDKPRIIIEIILLRLILIIILSLRLYLSYYILNINIAFEKIILIEALVAFSIVLSIAPGNIGIQEGIIGLSASLLGLSFDQALMGAVLDRISSMIIIFIFGLIYSKVLIGEFKFNQLNR